MHIAKALALIFQSFRGWLPTTHYDWGSKRLQPFGATSIQFAMIPIAMCFRVPGRYDLEVPEGFDSSDVVGMGVAAALARQFSQEQREFLPLIARVLKDSTPDQVELIETGMFKKSLRGVIVTTGDNRLTLEDPGRGPLQAGFTHVVRGIALKTERLSIEEWLSCVSEALERAAAENAEARRSLAKTLGLD